ncbi:MAG: 50S ribosomal protein L29 [Candidatus Kapabacteria bacterium]|nr:50S ribosomal protein L29 [Candidatus Kapabacteria bacterium]MBX7153798.1 50S ribosomal protein L29 [Bacteroidota bacterium]
MKPRKTADLRELSDKELLAELKSVQETLARQRFQHALKQLQDTAYLRILRKDIARMKMILNKERNIIV